MLISFYVTCNKKNPGVEVQMFSLSLIWTTYWDNCFRNGGNLSKDKKVIIITIYKCKCWAAGLLMCWVCFKPGSYRSSHSVARRERGGGALMNCKASLATAPQLFLVSQVKAPCDARHSTGFLLLCSLTCKCHAVDERGLGRGGNCLSAKTNELQRPTVDWWQTFRVLL